MDLFNVLFARRHGIAPNGDFFDTLLGRKLGDGGVWETENAPYFFRQSGGALNSRLLGKSKDKLVGASVGFNQLVPNTSMQIQTNSALTWQPVTASKFYLISGHKYLVMLNGKTVSGGNIGIRDTDNSIVYRPQTGYALIYNSQVTTASDTAFIQGEWNEGTTDAYLQFIDLTLLLGSTIADYAYTLESGTAGAGIAWLKSYGFFDKPYFAYDNGSLQSVNATKKICVGFNAWDEELEDGGINDSTGEKTPTSGQKRSKNYIPVIPNTSYYCKTDVGSGGGFYVYEYDANNTFVKRSTPSGGSGNNVMNKVIDVSANTHYLLFKAQTGTGGTFDNICINISNADLNGTYKAYEEHEYPLDTTVELRGLFKMDSDHKIYADGDTYESSGVVTRKRGSIELSTINWTYMGNTSQGFYGDAGQFPYTLDLVCAKYTVVDGQNIYDGTAPDMSIGVGANGRLRITNSAYTDATSLINNLGGVYLEYPLATPTTEQAEPFASPQNVDKAGTEEYVCNQKFVPVGHSTEYKCEPLP